MDGELGDIKYNAVSLFHSLKGFSLNNDVEVPRTGLPI